YSLGNVQAIGGITDTTYSLDIALNELSMYYWHVKAVNVCGEGTYSDAISFTTKDVPSILLVDDDDNTPNTRVYYTAALDALGWAYDVWNTNNSDDEPAPSDLAPYSAVIWFSGDEAGGFAGPDAASETVLANWLDNSQGCFFLSSQDYYLDRDLTAFMTDYLGVATVTEGEGNYGQVVGEGVFSALGTRSLLYPFNDSADWVTPDVTAAYGFMGTNDRGAALTKEAGYKTSFWAFPLEALYGPQNRRNAIDAFISWCGLEQPSYGVTLSSDQAQSAPAGTVVTYTVTVENTGNVTDLYTLSIAGNTWTAALSTESITVNAGETGTFTVAVTIPSDANVDESDAVTVTATSVSDGTVTASTTLTTTAANATFTIYLPIVRQ
ncbi:MAG TPA: FixG Ig-like domain-containing protein, partial [Anaerolineales bacterium]|nr:FixG Ig-like domain-containing protein [Anaerolineales bacterium]